MTDNDEDFIDMEAVCRGLRGHDIPAFVQQTGGGVATIYVGRANGEGFYPLAAGPGWFNGPGWTEGRADPDDFYLGADDYVSSDDYERITTADTAEIVEIIRAKYQAGIHTRLSITVDLENAALAEDDSRLELERILRNITERVVDGENYGEARDSNGNVVAWFSNDGQCGFSNWGERCTADAGHHGDHQR